MTETEFRPLKITLSFSVPVGDVDGVMTEALFDAAVEHAPSDAVGLVASANTVEGKVWIVFTLPHASEEFANSVGRQMRSRVENAVFSGDDVCVSAV